jgi:hypothetical protein
VRVGAGVDRVQAQVVPVREQPRRRRLPGARRAADPQDVVEQR